MSTGGLIFGGIFYISVAIFLVGFVYRVWTWVRAPVPLKIALTPAPKSMSGVITRVATEVVIFRSLFRADKPLWVAGWLFHVAFLIIILNHLRYFLYPVPGWVMDLRFLGVYAGLLIVLLLLYLFVRRLVYERVRYISTFADYGVLALIFCIAGTGILMTYFTRVYVYDVKRFMMSIMTFTPGSVPFPDSIVFLIHFSLICALLIYFPFSKLMHSGGIFFSPTRNQRDNPRDARYINPWNEGVKVD
jgi:nitrate reductase gamma subunit